MAGTYRRLIARGKGALQSTRGRRFLSIETPGTQMEPQQSQGGRLHSRCAGSCEGGAGKFHDGATSPSRELLDDIHDVGGDEAAEMPKGAASVNCFQQLADDLLDEGAGGAVVLWLEGLAEKLCGAGSTTRSKQIVDGRGRRGSLRRLLTISGRRL